MDRISLGLYSTGFRNITEHMVSSARMIYAQAAWKASAAHYELLLCGQDSSFQEVDSAGQLHTLPGPMGKFEVN